MSGQAKLGKCALQRFSEFVINSWNWSANFVIDICSRSTFCDLAKSNNTSKDPL